MVLPRFAKRKGCVMHQLVCKIPLEVPGRRHLEAIPGLTVHVLDYQDGRWDLRDDLVPGTEVLLCKVPPGNLDKMKELRLIQLASVGYEHLRRLQLGRLPLRVCNARGIFDTAIGEWNLAMMIALQRDLRSMIRNQEASRWERPARLQQEVRGRVVGLWGYGGIGRETARLAKALGMIVHVLTRSGVKPRHDAYALPMSGDPDGVLPDRVFTAGQERDFLAGLDFLILALPRTRQSNGMVGEAELKALPRSAYLLNPARGPIVQEAALVRALHEGWIAGAALDTHFAYPLPPEHPLWQFPNVILTPHIAGADHSRDFSARIADLTAQNLARLYANRPLFNEISQAEWEEASFD